MPASETNLSTIRTPNGLFMLVIKENIAYDFETNKPAELTALTKQDASYEIIRTPLTSQTEHLSAEQKRLLAAWEALAHVQEPNADIQTNIATVLKHTVPELPIAVAMAPLPWEQEVKLARVVPTAAHPRAYQGTKYKPPKDKATVAIDLRLYLCDADGLSRLLASLPPYVTADWTASKQEMTHPEPFRLLLAPSLRQEAEAALEPFLALYWELSLDRQPQLLAAIALLVNRQPTANTRQWCQIIAQQPEEWRLTFASLLLATDASRVEATSLPPSVIPLFWEVQSGPCPVYRLFCLLRALANGLDCDYLATGFRLADQVHSDYAFLGVRASGYFPERAISLLLAHLETSERYYSRLAMELWKHCGELRGFGHFLDEISWTYYTPNLAYSYVHLFMDCVYDDLPDRWNWVEGHSSQIENLLRSTPADYQAKFVAHTRDLLWYFETTQAMERIMPSAFILLQRLCRPPYKPSCDTTDVTVDFLAHLSCEALERFLQAPDASFQRLEEACRLENNARLIGYGTWSLTRHLPEFSSECFLNYPAKLFKVAKRLGGLPVEIREQVTREFARLPLLAADLIHKDLPDADALIQGHRQEGVFNPVPRKLQEHLAGERTLNERQIGMYCEQMERQLSLTRLETLERLALAALQGTFTVEADSPDVSHALTIYHSAQENRRALQKFLKAYWSGNTDYLLHHPRTQAWLKKHPQINAKIWQQGIIVPGESAQHGTLQIAVEQEPLEALKLGTYVGSCLGLGGSFTYSAVAAVLDINKQVVYARDSCGNVIARQLLALSEQNQLVCFEVYPLSTPDAIRQIFADYDRRFAEALNLGLYSHAVDDTYDVATILSHDWWDDCAWDLSI